VIGLAGYKVISIMFLVVVVALASGSPAFAGPQATVTVDPQAACPGATVTVTSLLGDVVGGGISVAAVSPVDALVLSLSSDPDGLIASQQCSMNTETCTFVVSESATCGRHYDVNVLVQDQLFGSATFDVPSSCCPAVGGCVQPVNTFALLSPWLAVIGLVGCISTVAVVARKRRP
jgi:hypothetical protein